MALYTIIYVLFQSIQNIHEITQIEFINIRKVDSAPDTRLHTVRQQIHYVIWPLSVIHRDHKRELVSAKWKLDFFSRCRLELSRNAHFCLSVHFHRDDTICKRWDPPGPFSLSHLLYLSPSPVYYILVLALSCYPSPFFSLSLSLRFTKLERGC